MGVLYNSCEGNERWQHLKNSVHFSCKSFQMTAGGGGGANGSSNVTQQRSQVRIQWKSLCSDPGEAAG